MMLKKRPPLVILVLIFVLALGAPFNATKVWASNLPQFRPMRWSNIAVMGCSVHVTGTTASCLSYVEPEMWATKTQVVMTLSRIEKNGSYTNLNTWTQTRYDDETNIISETYDVTAGYSYRVDMAVLVELNGLTESAAGNYIFIPS